MALTRAKDWVKRLNAYIELRRHEPFVWGVNDCCLYPADWILEVTGVDPAANFRGYTTERQAMLIVSEAGGMRELALAAGLPEIQPGRAQRGDIVLANIDGVDTFGIVTASAFYARPSEKGTEFRPPVDLRTAFKV